MIKLQHSKKYLKTYNQLLANTLSSFGQGRTPMKQEQSARLPSYSPSKRQDEEYNSTFGRTISKMVKIQFQEGTSARQNQEVRMKRKMMTSSEKFQTRKKNVYSNCAKQACSKSKTQRVNHSNITIGSHSIQKMDYTMTLTSDFKFIDDSALRKKLRLAANATETNSTSLKQQPKVLIFQKNESNRLEELLLKPSKIVRLPCASKADEHLTGRVYSSNPQTKEKAYSIEEFIPVRKNSTRREPFVFGLSEKQMNPERNRQKLLLYHDFLWKINYSNGLYIKPSDPDTSYKAYIGHGNNSNLIKGILRRRYWWVIVDKSQGCNFIWTQLKVNSVFKENQTTSTTNISNLYPHSPEIQSNTKTQPIIRLLEGHNRIFNSSDLLNWTRHMKKNRKAESLISDRTYKNRIQFLNCKQISRIEVSSKLMVHNHLQQNYYIGNKKSLFYHMKKYYELQNKNVFQVLPLTFHISKGVEDAEYRNFMTVFEEGEKRRSQEGGSIKNVWIMKPGENSNRGIGITVCYSQQEVRLRIKAKEKNHDGSLRTFIIQKYIEKPLLFKGRKFDIRHYLLLTSFNGIFKAYWFPQGYIRTSSSFFSLKRGTNLLVHLTNDAVQKNADDYGRYQKGNKISYQKFQHYLNKTLEKGQRNCFFDKILPEMKEITLEAVKSTFLSLDPNKRQHNFELLGMDFMIDEELKPWLIEINTNPCLELSCPLLSRLIPNIIEQTMRICIDPFFPPPQEWSSSKKMQIGDNPLNDNDFELIFDESVDRESVLSIYGSDLGVDSKMGRIDEDDEIFQNEGAQLWEQKV